MSAYIFPGDDRLFIVHNSRCNPIILYFAPDGFKLFGDKTALFGITITRVIIK
ncbi:MAG: hypothetical protein ACRCXT_05795 [Paraclostridium sp.]